MIYGLYQSAAGMMVEEYRQGVLSNNLANADTVGFKRDLAVFAERTPAWRTGERQGPSAVDLQNLSGGLWLGRTRTDFSEGTHTQTGNPLDVALEGPGFLGVQINGQPQYTRDGRLQLDATGTLVAASDGAPVLGEGGAPLRMNPRGGQPSIDSSGFVSQDGALVGRLTIVDFADHTALQKTTGQRFVAPDGAAQRSSAYVQSGTLEQGTVEAIHELVSMLDATRAHQLNAQMVTLQDQTLGRLTAVIQR